MMDQTNIYKSSPTQKDKPTPLEPTTMVPTTMMYPPLEGGNYTKTGDMWNLRHEISSPKLYELLIKTELKRDTALDLKNFYNHIKMCINAVTRLIEDLRTDYQSIKIHYDFEEYFIPDHDHPSYSWNVQIYTSLGHSLLVAMNNETFVKYFMAPQACKVFSTHDHEISGWAVLSRLLYSRATHLGGMNGDVQSDLETMTFNSIEKLEDFHSRVLRLQQETMLSGEIVSPTILFFQYTKAFTNSEKLRDFIAPKMTYLITFLDKNGKSSVYIGGDIHGIYLYLEMIGAPTTLTTSGQSSYNLAPSSSRNNDAANIQPVITDIHIR